ncbi:MAG: hypothetical protein WAP58_01375, partial [Peptococcia bacterium]
MIILFRIKSHPMADCESVDPGHAFSITCTALQFILCRRMHEVYCIDSQHNPAWQLQKAIHKVCFHSHDTVLTIPLQLQQQCL